MWYLMTAYLNILTELGKNIYSVSLFSEKGPGDKDILLPEGIGRPEDLRLKKKIRMYILLCEIDWQLEMSQVHSAFQFTWLFWA